MSMHIIIKKSVTAKSELFYPMMLKEMTDEETKEYYRKKYYELSLKWFIKNKTTRRVSE